MSKYARKLEKIENGNWFMKSAALMGIAVLGLIVFGAPSALGEAVGIGAMLMGVVQMIIMFCPVLVVHMARNYYQSRCVIA